jgi:hypothetical protein
VDSDDDILPAVCDENTSPDNAYDFDSEQLQYCPNSAPTKARRSEEAPVPPRGRANDFDSTDSEKYRSPRQTSRVPGEPEPLPALSPSSTATHR